MNDSMLFLITLLYRGELIRVALKVAASKHTDHLAGVDWNNKFEWSKLEPFLPAHVRDCGPIVAVDDTLFDVTVVRVD